MTEVPKEDPPGPLELDLQRHQTEDGTTYWSLLIGNLALHILAEDGHYVAMDLLGRRLGTGRSPEEAGLRALSDRG